MDTTEKKVTQDGLWLFLFEQPAGSGFVFLVFSYHLLSP